MTERIKELMKQTGTPTSIPFDQWCEKFAELIVRKCAKVAHRYTPDYEELEYSHLIKNKILEHFGVEK